MSAENPNVLAEETHASWFWGAILLLPLIGMIRVAAIAPVAGVRLALALSSLILVGAAIMALTGFRYTFTPAGLEIRTLGYRLRSIAPGEIREYAIADWNIARGYGIRGLGNRRAYVWGNSGVRIKTTNGEVFLGHSDPEKIIHDLDLIKQFAP